MDMAEGGKWRVRSTDIDNAPEGRPIYWNSAWALWLSACGRLRMAFTGEPLARAIESASLWANLPVFFFVLILFSGWVWRRWGGAAGALAAVALAGHRKFYEGFYPGYCDHHGLISAAVLGVVLGAVLAGAGWWKKEAGPGFSLLPESERQVRRALVISAVCGALGLWVSAASLVVTIAIVGIAALLVALFRGRADEAGIACVSGTWRLWGRVGGGLSLVFYLMENFPDRLGLRLEANHPLYSLAWWGAGEAIAAVLVWRTESRSARWLASRLSGWGIAVLAAPAVILTKGAKVFAPLDPFLARIHDSIHEFEPLWVAISRAGWKPYGDQLFISLVILVLWVVWRACKPSVSERLGVGFIGGVALAATLLGWYQNRWLLTAAGPQLVLVMVLLLAVTARFRAGWRGLVIVAVGALLYVPGPWILASERRLVERVRDVQLGETMQLLYRDIAGALLKTGADSHSVVLASPNASVGVGYYGQLRTVGTLYWENRDGLLVAAEILGARDDAEAAARIHARGVTHVVMISSYDFLSEYRFALRGGSNSPEEYRVEFGHRLLYQHRVPVWLGPLGYSVPAPLTGLGFRVALFAVDFETPVSVAHERIGRYQLTKGERDLAEASFMAALTADASRAEPWLLEGQLMLSAGRVNEAYNFIHAGIVRSPASQRDALIKAAAAVFSRHGAEGRVHVQALLDMLNVDRRAEPAK
ncbi:MAG: hypothetical protein K0R17_274 [Rariglobus sp.]|nr:hypothetical protein [Rariglobus sp.]